MDYTILIWVGIFALFYFMMIRPMQKKAKEQQAQQRAVEVGSRVLLTSGIVGTVRHIADRQAIVEVSPGVELTVVRGALARVVAPEEEDFEYEDEDEDGFVPDDVQDPIKDEADLPVEPEAPSAWPQAFPDGPQQPSANR